MHEVSNRFTRLREQGYSLSEIVRMSKKTYTPDPRPKTHFPDGTWKYKDEVDSVE